MVSIHYDSLRFLSFLENHPVTSIDDFLLEEFPAATVGTVGIRDGLVGSL